MADNATLTNKKTTFDADTNPDIPVRSTEKTSKQVQHVIIDAGGAGAESLVTAANPLPVTVISGGSSGTEYTEDDASAANPVGTQVIARRRDSLASETTTDGDVTAVNSTSKGELYVKHIDAIPVTGTFTQTPYQNTYAHTRPSLTDNTSGTVIAANARKEVKISNNTNFPFFLRLDGGTAVMTQGWPLGPGTSETFFMSGAITGIQNSGGALALDVHEGT